MFNLLRFFLNRRVASQPVPIDRRVKKCPSSVKEATRILSDSVDRFERAVIAAQDRKYK